MARARRSRLGAAVESEIVRRARGGESRASILADIRQRFPNANVRLIQAATTRGVAQRAATRSISSLNRGQFSRWSTVAGCGPNQTVRLGVVVTYTDQQGNVRDFRLPVDRSGAESGRLSDLIGRAAAIAVGRARERESTRPGFDRLADDPAFRVQIVSAECR